MAEFHNDEQRQGYLAALEREKEGYKHRKLRGKRGRDPLSVQELDDRIEQVLDEISRVKGEVSVEEDVEVDETAALEEKSMIELAELAKEVGVDNAEAYAKPGVKKRDLIGAIMGKLGGKES